MKTVKIECGAYEGKANIGVGAKITDVDSGIEINARSAQINIPLEDVVTATIEVFPSKVEGKPYTLKEPIKVEWHRSTIAPDYGLFNWRKILGLKPKQPKAFAFINKDDFRL